MYALCPPQVYGVVWNNFLTDKDAEGNAVVLPTMFCTYGVKHLKFWTQGFDDVSGGGPRGRLCMQGEYDGAGCWV